MTCWFFGTKISLYWAFFRTQKTWVSTSWRKIGEVLQSWRIKIFVHNDADEPAWNHIITFLLRRQFLLHKWPASQMQLSKWKTLNIQWFSLWEKSSKTWYYLYLPNIIQCSKNFMALFYGWSSTASRLEPLRGGSLLFTTRFPEIPGTHFIDLGRMKGWVDLGATQQFWTRDPSVGNPET